MGQFARDYKRLFGELPSETLLAARRDRDRHPDTPVPTDAHQDLAGWVASPLRSWGLQ